MSHVHGRAGMTSTDLKEDLHTYLQGARETLLWKLDGLGEYDVRRPLTPTGTNLLGLVNTMPVPSSGTSARYSDAHDISLPWLADDAEPNADLWAAPGETRGDIVRELIDGSAGLLKGHDNFPAGDPAWWGGYRDRVEAAARVAGGN